jgi:septal ring factor EnvC (AmiA/AmiB activator)
MQFGAYQLPMTPSDFGSDHDSPYCSPRPPQTEPVFAQTSISAPAERTHTTSGVSLFILGCSTQVLTFMQRRRAQNRAAQRAFRERKEKHARDLETQLAALTDKYNKLETSHTELNAAYEKLRKTIELLTQDNDDAEGEEEDPKALRRRSSNSDTLRKLLEILHGDFKGVTVKTELA